MVLEGENTTKHPSYFVYVHGNTQNTHVCLCISDTNANSMLELQIYIIYKFIARCYPTPLLALYIRMQCLFSCVWMFIKLIGCCPVYVDNIFMN